MCKAVCYIRVSTDQQVKNGEGLAIQEQHIKDYCKKNKITLEKIFTDEAVSGAAENREGLNNLLDYIQKNKIDKVLIQKYDRLSRDVYFSLWIRKELKRLDVELISISEESFAGSDPINELMQNIIFSFAEFEKARISERMLSGRVKKAAAGKKATGNTPFGYKYKYNDHGKNIGVVIDPSQAETVKQIYKDYLNGLSLQKIKDKLDNEGIFNNNGREFSRQGIYNILQNRFYLGLIKFGDIEKDGEHEAIINRIIFGKVQNRLKN